MRRRGPWLIGLPVVMAAIAALGNVPPTMDDLYVATVQDTPVSFELRAQDEDIDPTDPEAHPLRFVLVEGPSHGVLIGDLEEVWYEGPHDAAVELTYVPSTGYVGVDAVAVLVVDPYDETAAGTVTIEIDVTGRRAEGLLSGNWSMNATWVPESGSFIVFATQLREVYRIGPLAVKGTAAVRKATVGGVDQIVFDTLRFDGDVKLGTLSLASSLSFDPNAPTDPFDYWRTTMGFGLAGVSFRHTSYLTWPVTSSYQSLFAQGSVGGLGITNTLRIDVNDACSFVLGRNDVAVSWSWCDLDLLARLSVTREGFEEMSFGLADLPVSSRVEGLTLDVELTFLTEAEELSVRLSWRPLTSGCIRLYSQLNLGGRQGMVVDGFTIYGVRVECDIGGVKAVSATSVNPSKNAMMTGQTDYWEVVRASGTLTGCCGVAGRWGLATYFNAKSEQLFDWGMTTGSFELGLTDDVSANVELVMRSGELGDPKVELSFGWTVRW